MLKKFSLAIFIAFMASVSVAYSFWGEGIRNPDPKVQSENLGIGDWIFNGQVYNPTKDYVKGDIVFKNGKIYKVINNVGQGDRYHDPERPNDNFFYTMKYVEITKDYKSFHYYSIGNYVIYNNALYYRSWFAHSPNTYWETNPSDKFWERNTALEGIKDELWYRNMVYYEGDIVYYISGSGGMEDVKRYKCIKSVAIEVEPPSSSEYWASIN